MELQGLYDYDDLAQIMGRMAGGDEAAVVTLYERYGGPIAAAVRRVARHRPGRLADDEVPGVVLEVCFDLVPVAGGWSPEGGALPWVWARHRVANVVDRALGQQFHPLDEVRLAALDRLAAPPPGPASDEPSLLTTLGRMVPDLAGAALLAEALDRGGVSTRDPRAVPGVRLREALGQRRPGRRGRPRVRHARGLGPPGRPPCPSAPAPPRRQRRAVRRARRPPPAGMTSPRDPGRGGPRRLWPLRLVRPPDQDPPAAAAGDGRPAVRSVPAGRLRPNGRVAGP